MFAITLSFSVHVSLTLPYHIFFVSDGK